MLEQRHQNLAGLFLQLDLYAVFAKFSSLRIEFEGAKNDSPVRQLVLSRSMLLGDGPGSKRFGSSFVGGRNLGLQKALHFVQQEVPRSHPSRVILELHS